MLFARKHFLFFLLIISGSLFSQQNKIDSLLKILPGADDTSQVDILNSLSKQYLNTGNYTEAMNRAMKAKELSEEWVPKSEGRKKLFFKTGIAISWSRIGLSHYYRGNYDEALKCYLESLKEREEIKSQYPDDLLNAKGLGGSYTGIGAVYMTQGNMDKALENYRNALGIVEEIAKKYPGDLGNKQGIAASYNNIGLIYMNQGKYEEALQNQFKSLKIEEEISAALPEEQRDQMGVADSYSNIALIYGYEGKAAADKKIANEKFGNAVKYQMVALKLQEEVGEKKGIVISYNNMGDFYLKQNKLDSAFYYLNLGLPLAKEIEDKDDQKDIYNSLSDLFGRKGDYKNAYEYHKLYSDAKDSLLNEESSEQIAEMQTKYETEKKEQQIQLLNKDKEIQDAAINRQQIVIWSVAGGFLVVLFLSLFIYKERKKSEKLLLNILPAETAKELKQNGKAIPRHYGSVTVMFTDFKGFTNIAEKLSAEELVSELDFLFKKFDEIISKYNIEKIKTIGDAYMCASGLPTPNSDHAENIVRAALEIQRFMKQPEAAAANWQLRIGIHSGPVTAGVVGDKKFAYDIWGDTVNTASRMESSGEPGKINISGATYELVKEKFKSGFRGKIPAKNKGEIDMYFVEAVS